MSIYKERRKAADIWMVIEISSLISETICSLIVQSLCAKPWVSRHPLTIVWIKCMTFVFLEFYAIDTARDDGSPKMSQ